VYAEALNTPAGPLVDAHSLPRLDCIPCWHDLDPRFGVAWDLFGDGKTAVKASLGRYVALASFVQSRTFSPQTAIVSSTSRSWTTSRSWSADLVPNCDLRNPSLNDECGPMVNKNFGQSIISTTPDPDWIKGWGKRGYSWSGSVSIDRQVASGVALNAGYYRTSYGNQTVTHNRLTTQSDYTQYCIVAPVDSRLRAGISGQRICGFYDVNPDKFGYVNNIVTRASNFGKATEYYNGADVNLVARIAHGINLAGGWNVGNSISTLTMFPGATTSKANQCFVNNSPQDLYNCETGNPYQHRFRVNGSVPLPWGLQAAAVYQNLPGPNYDANYTVTSAQIAGWNLGRPLSGGVSTVTINLVQPLSQFLDERINQIDLRFSKIMHIQHGKIQVNFDVYNMTNNSSVLWVNSTYLPASNWQSPTSTMDARLVKFGLQYDF
jgi:hypothetical protein